MTVDSELPGQRDMCWRGPPNPVRAWAALKRDGTLMANSVRERPKDVIRACGDCVPLPVLITYVADEIIPEERPKAQRQDWMMVYRTKRVPLYWLAADGSRRELDDPPARRDWSVEMSGNDDQSAE